MITQQNPLTFKVFILNKININLNTPVKTIRYIFLCLLFLLLLPSISCQAYTKNSNWKDHAAPSFSGGQGTKADPFLITSGEELALLIVQSSNSREDYPFLNQFFRLEKDIFLFDHMWNPIPKFYGNLDGNGKKISSLNIVGDKYQAFIQIMGGTIENLIIEECFIDGKEKIAGLAYQVTGEKQQGIIKNCLLSGLLQGHSSIGGLIGVAENGAVIESSVCNITIWGYYNIGGFAETSNDATFSNCYSTGEISGEKTLGGFISQAEKTTFQNNYTICVVKGNAETGGFMALSSAGNLNIDYNNFWNIGETTQSYSAFATGKSPDEMKQQSTYENWDFNKTWNMPIFINKGYPYHQISFETDTWSSKAANSFESGKGTQEEPYQIATAEQLSILSAEATAGKRLNRMEQNELYVTDPDYSMNNLFKDLHFQLQNDIDLVGKQWIPIVAFSGNFNGKNKKIKNMTINSHPQSSAFIDNFYSGILQNLIIEDCNIENASYAGGIVCGAYGLIKNCHVSGNIQASWDAGGFVCHFGGINSKIINSSSTATVRSLRGNTSGFAVSAFKQGTLINNFSQSIVNGNSTGLTSGFVALADGSTFIHNYSSSRIYSNNSNQTGGFVAKSYDYCYDYSNFWDVEVAQIDYSAFGTKKNTAEMKLQTTFTDWDFNSTWLIDPSVNNGYPTFFSDPPLPKLLTSRYLEKTCEFSKLDKYLYQTSSYTVTLDEKMSSFSPSNVTYTANSSSIELIPLSENGLTGCKIIVNQIKPSKTRKESVSIKATLTYQDSKGTSKKKIFNKKCTLVTPTRSLLFNEDQWIIFGENKKEKVVLNYTFNLEDLFQIPTNSKVKFYYSDEEGIPDKTKAGSKVVSVNGKGLLSFKGPGSTYLAVAAADSYDKKNKTYGLFNVCSITCPPVESVEFIADKPLLLEPGKTFDLSSKLLFKPVNPFNRNNMKVKWSSSDRKVVSVNSKGIIKAGKGEGSATITFEAIGGVAKGSEVPTTTIEVKVVTQKGKGL